LNKLIGKAAKLNIIKDSTVTQAGLAKDFRNLIHPGLEQRRKEVCDRATALAALAAAEAVARDLSKIECG
jgi:hypothetical protein